MNAFALAGLLVGCASWVDGTWLFAIDRNPQATEGCGTAVSTPTGTDYQFVDVYEADDGSVLVFFNQILDGTRDGATFTADWERLTTYPDGSSVAQGVELDAEHDGGLMVGTVRRSNTATSDTGETTACSLTYDFTGELVTSDDADFVGD